MKFIKKQDEPQELIEWKNADKMYKRGSPSWKRLPKVIKGILRERIAKEQGQICCYCERKLVPGQFHIEHLVPQNLAPEKVVDYTNLLCSCQKDLKKGEPRICGNSKGGWYDAGELISPLDPECEMQFVFTHDGQISPADSQSVAATVTIEKLNLNSDKLNKLRSSAVEPFLDLSPDELSRFVEEDYLVEKASNGGKFNEFHTTIVHLFGP